MGGESGFFTQLVGSGGMFYSLAVLMLRMKMGKPLKMDSVYHFIASKLCCLRSVEMSNP